MGIPEVAPRAVFLDRDGVLNEVILKKGIPHPPPDLASLRIYPDVPASLYRLKAASFKLVVVTNQPDVARGTQSRDNVDALNAHLAKVLPIDEIRVCFHDDADGCLCRKPLPGLLTAAPQYDPLGSYMIGDRWRDVEAGRRAGCRTVFIDRGYGERPVVADACFGTLAEAVEWILERDNAR